MAIGGVDAAVSKKNSHPERKKSRFQLFQIDETDETAKIS